jgi:hypothetical protein
MESIQSINLLPEELKVDNDIKNRIIEDYESFSKNGLPQNLENYILREYKLDLSSEYGGKKIKNPFGKASGQLSCTSSQVKTDGEAGLGFVVLKTVISQDKSSHSNMDEWKITAPKMVAEDIVSKNGKRGYTVTWKGRGWDKSFKEYLQFMEEALGIGLQHNMLVVPSCKYHLPVRGEAYNEEEYEYTTTSLLNSWKKAMGNEPMLLEKDFSPTLSGSDRSKAKDTILNWLDEVPKMIKKYCKKDEVILGLKLMNTLFEDEFQVEMLSKVSSSSSLSDLLILFNRLFDPNKEFEGKNGVAYGGWDLSDRNLKVLSDFRKLQYEGKLSKDRKSWSATGNIESGRTMVEYGLRGCSSGQIHTFFQIPVNNYRMSSGSRSQKAMNELLFNPVDGMIVSMLYLKNILKGNNEDTTLKWEEIYTLHERENIFHLFGRL